MTKQFDFEGLFIFEMANNHQGSVEHGRKIIEAVALLAKEHGVRGAIKFQFRDLDTFIHPHALAKGDGPHIKRFLETRLSESDFKELAEFARSKGLLTAATPFDEASVPLLKRLNIDIAKIASCSADDWPLIAAVAELKKPTVISTAGLALGDIDRLVREMTDKGVHFALMHCIGIYPTPTAGMRLHQITLFKRRYPGVTIGYSGHEPPAFNGGIMMAYALGARLFERHVGVPTETVKLNGYSLSPQELQTVLKAYRDAAEATGGEARPPASAQETESLRTLKRGVYAAVKLAPGEILTREKVYFAMPLPSDGLHSGIWEPTMHADRAYLPNEALSGEIPNRAPKCERRAVLQVLDQVRGLLTEARISLGNGTKVEVSHHYGMDAFREFGAALIETVNRQYAKKLVIQLPRQKHPYHYHKIKEETFHVLHGDLEVEVEGHRRLLRPGDTVTILPMQWHKFQTSKGVIFEELSTKAHNNDSVYEDPAIQRLSREQRKTWITLEPHSGVELTKAA